MTTRLNNTHKGFSLVEVLVVMLILSTLAAISFPIVATMQDKGIASETNLRMSEYTIAVNQYYNENGHLPNPGGGNDDGSFERGSHSDLTSLLLNIDPNPASKVYLLSPNTINDQNGIKYEGSGSSQTVEDFVDGWGTSFKIQIDYDLNGVIDAGDQVQGFNVLLTSAGPDRTFDTDDDLISW